MIDELYTTLTNLSVEGANKKQIKRCKGKLVVVKERLQDGTYDTEAEAMIYDLARYLGVPCAPACLLSDGRATSEVDESVMNKLVHALDFLKIEEASIEDIWTKMEFRQLHRDVFEDFSVKTIFDILTRQLDRNLTNFSFIVDTNVKLYRLYDNGLSLFSTTKINNSNIFRMRTGEMSDDVLDFILSKNNSDITNFIANLDKSILLSIWEPYRNRIGNNLDELIDWVINQRNYILSRVSCTKKSNIFGKTN